MTKLRQEHSEGGEIRLCRQSAACLEAILLNRQANETIDFYPVITLLMQHYFVEIIFYTN